MLVGAGRNRGPRFTATHPAFPFTCGCSRQQRYATAAMVCCRLKAAPPRIGPGMCAGAWKFFA